MRMRMQKVLLVLKLGERVSQARMRPCSQCATSRCIDKRRTWAASRICQDIRSAIRPPSEVVSYVLSSSDRKICRVVVACSSKCGSGAPTAVGCASRMNSSRIAQTSGKARPGLAWRLMAATGCCEQTFVGSSDSAQDHGNYWTKNQDGVTPATGSKTISTVLGPRIRTTFSNWHTC